MRAPTFALNRVLRMTKCCGIWMTRVLEPELLRSEFLPLLKPSLREDSCQVRCINGYRVAARGPETSKLSHRLGIHAPLHPPKGLCSR